MDVRSVACMLEDVLCLCSEMCAYRVNVRVKYVCAVPVAGACGVHS